MDLAQHVAANLEVSAAAAERGVGAILNALRMVVPRDTFERLKDEVPDAESYMGRALMSAARTGEMPGPTGPSGLARALLTAGIKREDMARLGRIVLEHVRPVIGEETIRVFLDVAPVLRE
jgi:uncharacterized protein VcgC/VcgE DUF2780